MIRILIVDDSSICRDVLADILEREGDIEIVGEAASGEQALTRIETLAPDVITLDIQMPGMGGLATIDEIMRRSPRPILVVTGLDTRERDLAVEATRRGAYAVANKVAIDDPEGAASLRATVRSLAGTRSEPRSDDAHASTSWPTPAAGDTLPILAFGCSAGGPKALSEILDALPRDLRACIAIANHLPADFVSPYARLLWSQHRFPVTLVESPTPPEPGTIVLAPGGCHLALHDGRFVSEPAPSANLCPSVDRLLETVAGSSGAHAGVILSGLGSDGARGLAAMRGAGQLTIAQSRESASVFGMPRAAAGVAVEVLATQDIPRTLLRWLDLRAGARSP